MCLAVPGKIVELCGQSAVADLHGNRIHVSTILTPDAAVGDWVLVHAGFAIEKLDAAAAASTFAILRDVQRAAPTPLIRSDPVVPASSEVAHA